MICFCLFSFVGFFYLEANEEKNKMKKTMKRKNLRKQKSDKINKMVCLVVFVPFVWPNPCQETRAKNTIKQGFCFVLFLLCVGEKGKTTKTNNKTTIDQKIITT